MFAVKNLETAIGKFAINLLTKHTIISGSIWKFQNKRRQSCSRGRGCGESTFQRGLDNRYMMFHVTRKHIDSFCTKTIFFFFRLLTKLIQFSLSLFDLFTILSIISGLSILFCLY